MKDNPSSTARVDEPRSGARSGPTTPAWSRSHVVSASARALRPRPELAQHDGSKPGDLTAQAPGSPSVQVMSFGVWIFGGSAEDAQNEIVPGLHSDSSREACVWR